MLLTNTTISVGAANTKKSGMFSLPWLMVVQCSHHHFIGATVPVPPLVMVLQALYHYDEWWKHMLKIKNCVSFSNRAGAAVYAAPLICSVCTVLAHFSVTTIHNNWEFHLPHPELIEGKSQRDVFYLGRPIASIGGGGGLKSAKVHCNGAANIKNFKK